MNPAVIAAWIGPLIATMAGLGGTYVYVSRKRQDSITELVNGAVSQLDKQLSDIIGKMDTRLSIVEEQLSAQNRQLDKQDSALAQAVASIARIEGRLMPRTPEGQ